MNTEVLTADFAEIADTKAGNHPSHPRKPRSNSSPYDRLRAIAEAKGDDFDAMLQEYLRAGIVVSNPEAFLMALPITIGYDERAWFVKAAAGNLRLIARMFPTFRPWIVFDRSKGSKKQRVYSSRRMLELIS